MYTLTISWGSLAVSLIAVGSVLFFTSILHQFSKQSQTEKSIKEITAFIEEYFINTDSGVQVTCIKLEGIKRFVALIQSSPLKRFRFSSVLESNLIAHIFKVTGNTVEKIYWGFPIKPNKDLIQASEENELEVEGPYFFDDYFMDKSAKDYKVSEVSWDHYESPKADIK